MAPVRSQWKENSSEIHAHGIYQCKNSSLANQITQNMHNDMELEL